MYACPQHAEGVTTWLAYLGEALRFVYFRLLFSGSRHGIGRGAVIIICYSQTGGYDERL